MNKYTFTMVPATRWQRFITSAFVTLFIIFGSRAFAQQRSSLDPVQVKQVEECIHDFAQAADAQDTKALDKVMHPEYRTVLNKAFGSQEVTILNKEAYIGMAKAGKIGGSKRSLQILSLDMQAEIARATVLLQSETTRFTSNYSMVRNAEGRWQVIQDFPHIDKL